MEILHDVVNCGRARGEWVDATVGHLHINVTDVTSIAPVRQ